MPENEPAWCPSIHRSATCLIVAGHDDHGHAGYDLDGAWLRWTDEEAESA